MQAQFRRNKMHKLIITLALGIFFPFVQCAECGVNFVCTSEKGVRINDLDFVCPENFVCNHEGRSCEPCIRANCNSELLQFACDSKDERLVKIGKYGVSCIDGYKCNNHFLSPCEPCISKDDKLEQPFVQPKNSTIAMNILPRAIMIPDTDLIDCNDGKSFLQPCRPGPAGANYYFKCTLTWYMNYALSVRTCNTLYSDKLCHKLAGLCLPLEP